MEVTSSWDSSSLAKERQPDDSPGEGDDEAGAAVSPSKAIVDTGTTYFTADGGLYNKLNRKLPSAPCSATTNYPDITYKLKDTSGKKHDLTFSQNDYMVS